MIITRENLNNLRTSFRLDYQRGYDEASPEYGTIATTVPSSSKTNTYGWLGKFPSLQEWVGDRQLQSIQEHSYSVTNKPFESTVPVDRFDIEDDNLGIYNPLMMEMGRAAAIHPDELVFPLLAAGMSTVCYDGQNFFDVEHPVNSAVDGKGQNTLVSNYQDGDKPAWYLMDCSRAIKPVLFQQRTAPKFTLMNAETDEAVFNSHQYRYGIDCRDNVGFSFWQMAYMSKAELTPDNLWKAYTALRQIKADGGRSLGIMPTHLVVPLELARIFHKKKYGACLMRYNSMC